MCEIARFEINPLDDTSDLIADRHTISLKLICDKTVTQVT